MKQTKSLQECNNPYKKGDKVRLKVSIKDAYQEVWHEKGEILEIKAIHNDGKGLMFWSDLGTHFKNVEPVAGLYASQFKPSTVEAKDWISVDDKKPEIIEDGQSEEVLCLGFKMGNPNTATYALLRWTELENPDLLDHQGNPIKYGWNDRWWDKNPDYYNIWFWQKLTVPNTVEAVEKEPIVYFIEHKENGLWWYPEDTNEPRYISTFNGGRLRAPGFKIRDGWTNNPNDERIAYKTKKEAQLMIDTVVGVFPDMVEITEHLFPSAVEKEESQEELWISVKDELPTEGYYLVKCPNWTDCQMAVAQYDPDTGGWYYEPEGEMGQYVTHWMPLPDL